MNMQSEMPTVYVNMLGDFTIRIGDKQISDADSQSKKPWVLLKYLITFRKRSIMPDELIHLIWGEDSSSNPGGALKTLMFRVRKLLDPLGYSGHELIKQQRRTYVWNTKFHTVVDTDLFEGLYNQIVGKDNELTDDAKLELCNQAIDLYKGDFLPRSNWENWVIPLNNYYHSLYLEIIYQTIELLEKQDKQDMIAGLCQRAVKIEPFDENLHYNLILSLFKSGKQKEAIDQYRKTTDTFFKKFAITPSLHLRELFGMIHNTDQDVASDLSKVQEILNANDAVEGALYCEYAVFKYIYQMVRRSLSRSGNTVFLCMLSVYDSDGNFLKPMLLNRAMEALAHSIQVSLRRGDTFCRYSVIQYGILLQSASCENVQKVIKRIEKKFRQEYSRKDLSLEYQLQAVVPD